MRRHKIGVHLEFSKLPPTTHFRGLVGGGTSKYEYQEVLKIPYVPTALSHSTVKTTLSPTTFAYPKLCGLDFCVEQVIAML